MDTVVRGDKEAVIRHRRGVGGWTGARRAVATVVVPLPAPVDVPVGTRTVAAATTAPFGAAPAGGTPAGAAPRG